MNICKFLHVCDKYLDTVPDKATSNLVKTIKGAILTLSTSSNILLVSGTSGALGTVTGMGLRVLPSVPMEAVFTTWG